MVRAVPRFVSKGARAAEIIVVFGRPEVVESSRADVILTTMPHFECFFGS